MSQKNRQQFVDAIGGCAFDARGNRYMGRFSGTPTASVLGYNPGAIALDETNALVYYNSGTLASATWSVLSGVGGTNTFTGLNTFTGGVTITTTALTITDVNIALSATTGTQLGTAAAQKLGFWGATPVIQRSAYTQTYSTATRTHSNPTATALTVTDGTGTNDGTIGAITNNATTISAVQELAAAINALIVDVANVKGVVNSLVDDSQAIGVAT